jgi:hypothetical protein
MEAAELSHGSATDTAGNADIKANRENRPALIFSIREKQGRGVLQPPALPEKKDHASA